MTNTELIRKEIERRIGAMYNFSSGYSALNTCKELLGFIDSLPPEVDLEKEIEKCLKQYNMLAIGEKDFTEIAHHFYELGLKARKEE